MKKLLLPALLLSLSCLKARAQNKIIIDYSNQPKIEAQKIDIAKALIVRFTNCKSAITPPSQIEIKSGDADQSPITVQCEKDVSVDLPKIFTATGKTHPITFTINADKTEKGDNALSVSFYVKPNGKVTQAIGKKNPENDLQPLADNNSPAPLITYNPCSNRYAVSDINRPTANSLSYHNKLTKNKGVVFLIKNFNILKYDITVSNTFDTSVPVEPDLFKTVLTMLVPPKLESGAQNSLQSALSTLLNLNNKIKACLNQDCASFEAEKKSIVEKIKNVCKTPDVFNFDSIYNVEKNNLVADKKIAKPAYTTADFNKEIQDLYHLTVTPDSIVTETKKLLTLLVNTKFEYQYNVPQLQNADAIIFTLNIKPKDGVNGTIHVTDQAIPIPIKWGWKVDFTTGVYYSSIKNEQYALQDVVQGDSVIGKDIIKENSKNFGKSAVGVSALMHVFPRLGSVQPALSFGVGASLDLNYSFLAGAGVIFGNKNRFALSGGINWSSVKKLSEKYLDSKGQLIRQLSTVASIDTYNKVKTGFFLSVTYSLGLTNKTEKAAGEGDSNKADAK